MFRGAVNLAHLSVSVAVVAILNPHLALGAAALSGRVTAVSGQAEIIQASGRSRAAVGMVVSESDKIETGAGGALQVRFNDGSSFTVYEKTSIKIDQYRASSQKKGVVDSVIDLVRGKLRFFINPAAQQKNSAKFRTKTAVMGIRGTSGVIDAVNPDQTQLLVLSGKVEVFNPRFPSVGVFVGANLITRVTSVAAPSQPIQVSNDFVKSFVPQPPAAAGFTDDSADAAKAAIPPTGAPSEQVPAKMEEQSDEQAPAQKEEQSLEKPTPKKQEPLEEKKNNQNDQGALGAPKADPNAAPSNERSKDAAEQSSQQKKPSAPRANTLFAPGGEVIRPESQGSQSVEGQQLSSGTSPKREQSGATKNGEVPARSQGRVEQYSGVDVMRQFEKTSSQVKSTVESVERSTQQNIQITVTPPPSPQKIKVRINLPEN